MTQKRRTSLSVDPELYVWIKTLVKKKIFSSESHGIERCIYLAKERYEKEGHL